GGRALACGLLSLGGQRSAQVCCPSGGQAALEGLRPPAAGPWKRMKRPTECRDRMVHGQEGRGRYKSSALGTAADWKVCYLSKGNPISLLESLKDTSNYSDLIPSLRTNAPHLDSSSAKSFACWSRVPESGSPPSSAMRARTSSRPSAARSSALSRSAMARLMLAGATMP